MAKKRTRPSPRRRAAGPAQPNLASVVDTVKAEALRLADGKRSRIEVVSETEVIVR